LETKNVLGSIALALGVMSATATFAETKLSMATSWSGGPPLEIWVQNFADAVNELTRGEVEIEPFTAGTLGSALKVAETVENGVAEAGHTFIGYEYGADKTTVLFAGRPGGLNDEEMIHWLNTGGGKELWREYRLETAGVIAFPCTYMPREAGMFSSKRIQTLDDFDGVKLRTAGAWAEIAGGLGVSTVVVPGAEVYQALERGVVDAVEWSTLSLNQSSGFHKVAPYIIMPGFHQSVAICECSFNQDAWNDLTEEQQSAIETAAYLAGHRTYETTGNNDADAYQFFLDNGTEFVTVDDAVLEKVSQLVIEWEDKVAAEEGGWFQRVLDHQRAFQTRWENAHVYR
jgi:TRAP-type mannitol/chloroaromatic compound transport system substrate-binding protein